ncbi:hypothetical protein TRFO_07058 [Tritrichomonas foetus]|uniref:Uncharacterized protein n=1 Tax=Tritrichomonas foetus TaxID=1144522 RepID=A0A1J4JW16_9EUKA|nr:hypothetical protein TRFO_07058 [Tritrichomonas foetus]|eukprot:OHT02632.1 hypothetical protein TRFO_07058 [Tritrichomonas foetus]
MELPGFFVTSFQLLEEQINGKDIDSESINFYYIEKLFTELLSDMETDEDRQLWWHYFDLSKRSTIYFRRTDFLILLFNIVMDNLMLPNLRKTTILDAIESWSKITFPANKRIFKRKTTMNESIYELMDLWREAILENINLKQEMEDLTNSTNAILKQRSEYANNLFKLVLKLRNRRDEDQIEKRYIKYASDLIFTIDNMNCDMANPNYLPPKWDGKDSPDNSTKT